MAILVANYDEQRDYLSNFEPFVLDRLKRWPQHEEVKPKELRAELASEFNLPPIPINTVTLLRDRAKRDGYLRRTARGKYFTEPAALAGIEEIAPERSNVLTHFNALADAVRDHAKSVFSLDWSEEKTETALTRFVEEFGVEMAMARRNGGLKCDIAGDEALAVIYSFARRALDRDPINLEYLEEMVKASMLTNVLYFQDLGEWEPEITRLVVYIDTPIALRVLEVAPEEVSATALELVTMLTEAKVPIRIFDHTIDETIGVLNGVKGGLLRAVRGESQPEDISQFNHETIEHLLRKKWDAGDIEQLITELETRLEALDIRSEHTPPVTRELSLNERRFEEIFSEMGYTKEPQIIKDVRSLTAIHRLRNGQSQRELGSARAILVSSNPRFVRASNRFFSEQGHSSPVPQGITDSSLTTQLWLRKPAGHADVPRKLLMAESFAALSPSSELWSKYLEKIEKKKKEGEITDQQVKALVLSNASREGLIEVTHGSPSAVTDETPLEVLDRYGEVLKRPVEEELARTSDHLRATRAENEQQREELQRLQEDASTKERQIDHQDRKIRKLEKWKEDQDAAERKREKRIGLARAIAGVLGAILLLGLIFWLERANKVNNPLPLAVYGTLAGMAGLCSVGWGLQKPWAWRWKVIVGAGVVVGIFAALYGVLVAEL